MSFILEVVVAGAVPPAEWEEVNCGADRSRKPRRANVVTFAAAGFGWVNGVLLLRANRHLRALSGTETPEGGLRFPGLVNATCVRAPRMFVRAKKGIFGFDKKQWSGMRCRLQVSPPRGSIIA